MTTKKEIPAMQGKNRTRQLVTMAALAAVSIVLVFFIHFPIFPAVPFLEYDPADISILLCTFLFGPLSGFLMTVVVSLIQGLTVSAASGVYGILMHVIATSAYVLCAGLFYRFHRTRKGAVVALLIGICAMAVVMIPANLLITPLFMGVSVDVVVGMLGFIVLFNVIKAGINGIVTFIVYKPLKRVLKI